MGSEFTVWLPARRQRPPDVVATAPRERAASNGTCRILIVDDNVDANESLSLLLQTEGHDVRSAQDGQTALRLAREFKPQMVLLDLSLPNMDGYEIMRRLRADAGAHQPFVAALTGYGHAEERQRTTDAGFDHHFVKPVDFDELIAMISSLHNSRL